MSMLRNTKDDIIQQFTLQNRRGLVMNRKLPGDSMSQNFASFRLRCEIPQSQEVAEPLRCALLLVVALKTLF